MSDKLDKARQALALLSQEEREELFRAHGCVCRELGKLVGKHPSVAIGAFIGGLLGAVGADAPVPTPRLPIIHVGDCFQCKHKKHVGKCASVDCSCWACPA